MSVRILKYTQSELDKALDEETEACAKLADHYRLQARKQRRITK